MIAHFRTTFKKKEKIEMNDSIITAYTSFNQLLSDDTNRDIFFKENFYVMETPEGIKGYTNRYLLIILNCNGLQLNGLTFDASKNILKCCIVLSILHELNNYLRRDKCRNKEYTLISTTRRKEDYDGGELLFDVIFGVKFIQTLNEEQASYIMNINNWNKSTIDFRREIKETNTDTLSYIKCMESNLSNSAQCLFPNTQALLDPPDFTKNQNGEYTLVKKTV